MPLHPPWRSCVWLPLDAQGKHTLSCPKGGDMVGRHDETRDVMIGLLRGLGAQVVCREVVLDALTDLRMDIQYTGPRAALINCDITLVSPTSAQAMRSRADNRNGVAAGIAEGVKRRTYRQHGVVPLVLEHGGRAGPAFEAHLRRMLPTGPERSRESQRVWQTIATTLQLAQARTIQRVAKAATRG